jgi:hypothetical protein
MVVCAALTALDGLRSGGLVVLSLMGCLAGVHAPRLFADGPRAILERRSSAESEAQGRLENGDGRTVRIARFKLPRAIRSQFHAMH